MARRFSYGASPSWPIDSPRAAKSNRRMGRDTDTESPAAGGGLLHRRALLGGAALSVGAAGLVRAQAGANGAIGAGSPASMLRPGANVSAYGVPSEWVSGIKRITPPPGPRPGTSSRTPLEALEGAITPAGLHFERHHNGVPAIDPKAHRLLIHGLVKRPLSFDLEALRRYPMVSRLHFVECAGNSGGAVGDQLAATATAGSLHGLASCSEWTGVPLSILLDEAGLDPKGAWLLAEGADGAGMSRSVPVWKANDDAMIALFQNGEPIRPEQGYPMRLLLPGFQGNTNVKWLRRLKVTEGPTYTRDETSRYSLLMADGSTRLFPLELGVKSVILKPSPGVGLTGPGLYEISGIAWSGAGRVKGVEVSADGGKSWARAVLSPDPQAKAFTRFRIPWRWEGGPQMLLSRATDETGARQPTRAAWRALYAPGQIYNYNAINSWAVDASGALRAAHAS